MRSGRLPSSVYRGANVTQQSSDFVDLIRAFNDHEVDYIVVGAHALAAHGHVRATKDLDVWVRPEIANGERVYAALADFGAPLDQVSARDFATPGTIFQNDLKRP